MNSLEIDKFMRRCKVTKTWYSGCYPADQLPPLGENMNFYPKCMVINTQSSAQFGEHWCALFLPKAGHIEFYNSLGDWPPTSESIRKYLIQFSSVKFNRVQLQSDRSASCGRHVIFFLYMRCKGHSFAQIIAELMLAKRGADQKVNAFYRYINQQQQQQGYK